MTRVRRSTRFEPSEHGRRTHACAPIDEDVRPEPCATLHDLARIVECGCLRVRRDEPVDENVMDRGVEVCAAVSQNGKSEVAVRRGEQGEQDASAGGVAGQDEVVDRLGAQDKFEVGAGEGAGSAASDDDDAVCPERASRTFECGADWSADGNDVVEPVRFLPNPALMRGLGGTVKSYSPRGAICRP